MSLIGNNKTVLDVGCGKGYVAKALVSNGCDVIGIDISKYDGGGWLQEVLIGDIETMPLKFKKKFDVILLADVLEHLHNPKKTLLRLKPFLVNRGMLVVSVPNVANWKVRLKLLFGKFDYADQGIMDRTHLHFYTQKTIKELMDSTEFEIYNQRFVSSFPFPFFKKHLAKFCRGLFSFQFVFCARVVKE